MSMRNMWNFVSNIREIFQGKMTLQRCVVHLLPKGITANFVQNIFLKWIFQTKIVDYIRIYF